MNRQELYRAMHDVLTDALSLGQGVVIPDRDDGPRPTTDHLVVAITVHDLRVGEDELLGRDNAGTPEWRVEGERRGTVTVTAYGEDASGWLDTFVLGLPLPATQDALETAGIALHATGGTRDLSRVRGTGWERILAREFRAAWKVTSETEEAITVGRIDIDLTLPTHDTDPDPLEATASVSL